jgi:hypothetical protein
MFWAIMVFPRALRRDQHHVARVGEKVEPQGGVDGGAVDALGPGPIELAHRREAADAAASEATLEAPAGPFLLFVLDEMLQELGRAPAPFGGQGDDIVQVRGGIAQAEGGELVREWSHPASPPRVGGA